MSVSSRRQPLLVSSAGLTRSPVGSVAPIHPRAAGSARSRDRNDAERAYVQRQSRTLRRAANEHGPVGEDGIIARPVPAPPCAELGAKPSRRRSSDTMPCARRGLRVRLTRPFAISPDGVQGARASICASNYTVLSLDEVVERCATASTAARQCRRDHVRRRLCRQPAGGTESSMRTGYRRRFSSPPDACRWRSALLASPRFEHELAEHAPYGLLGLKRQKARRPMLGDIERALSRENAIRRVTR